VQWHLRFAKAQCLEIMLKPGDLILAREAMFLEPGWTLEERNEGALALAVFTRK